MDRDLHHAITTVLRGFDEGVFVRCTKRDGERDYLMRLAPYLRALAQLYQAVEKERAT